MWGPSAKTNARGSVASHLSDGRARHWTEIDKRGPLTYSSQCLGGRSWGRKTGLGRKVQFGEGRKVRDA